MKNILNLSVHIFDFQCQCIQWLLFIDRGLSVAIVKQSIHKYSMLSLSKNVTREHFCIFQWWMIWNRTINIWYSASKSIFFVVLSFSCHILSMSPLNYLSSVFPLLSNSICIFASSIQHHFCCDIFIRVESVDIWNDIECLSIWLYLCRTSVHWDDVVFTLMFTVCPFVSLFRFQCWGSLVYANNKINNNDLLTIRMLVFFFLRCECQTCLHGAVFVVVLERKIYAHLSSFYHFGIIKIRIQSRTFSLTKKK